MKKGVLYQLGNKEVVKDSYTGLYKIVTNRGLGGRFDSVYSHLWLPLDNFDSFIHAVRFLKENKHAIY